MFSTKDKIECLTKIYDRINNSVKIGKTYTYNFRYNANKELWKPTLKDTIIN